MKKLAVAVLLLLTVNVHAYADAKELLRFSTGILTAYALHEGGHAVAGYATGTRLGWQVGTYNQPLGFSEQADNDFDGAIVHASGLLTQLIVSDYILSTDSIDVRDNYVRGMLAWNVINPVVYVLDYWLIKRTNKIYSDGDGSYQGDLAGVEHYAGKNAADMFAIVTSLVALHQGYTAIKKQNWDSRDSRGDSRGAQTSLSTKPVRFNIRYSASEVWAGVTIDF